MPKCQHNYQNLNIIINMKKKNDLEITYQVQKNQVLNIFFVSRVG
jgi:hypothetical protein